MLDFRPGIGQQNIYTVAKKDILEANWSDLVDCQVLIGDEFAPTLQHESRNAALCVIGLQNPKDMEDDIFDRLTTMTDTLPRVVFVHSVGDVSLEA